MMIKIIMMMMMMMMGRRVTCLGTFSQTSLGTWLQTLRGTSVQTSKMEIDFVKHWIWLVSRKYWKNTISPPWPPASAHSRRLLAKPGFTKKKSTKFNKKKFYQKLNTRYGSSYIPPWFLFDFVFSSYHWKWERHDWFGRRRPWCWFEESILYWIWLIFGWISLIFDFVPRNIWCPHPFISGF